MRTRVALWSVAFVLVAAFGYWLATSAAPRRDAGAGRAAADAPGGPQRLVVEDEPLPKFRTGQRLPGVKRDKEAMRAGAFEGQRVLVFKDQAALERFLERWGSKVRVLGRLDGLNALRVGIGDVDDLAGLSEEDLEASLIFPVVAPPPADGSVQPGAVALRDGLLEWLGIKGDHSAWGKGVTVAILDTGVVATAAFTTAIRSINLVDAGADPAGFNGHGTAVASMVIGNDPLTPGVAPGVSLLSVRIAGADGQSNSYLLAEGIVAAVDAGARLINISMGSEGDSPLVRKAIEYAGERGALIIAAAGNYGTNQVLYPAANDGVIAVGGVDATGEHLAFSNTGQAVDLAAPGYGINAAWPGDQSVMVSGTSFSAPIVTGAVAAVMTEAAQTALTPAQAYQLLTAYLNDGGAAGVDAELGAGMPDLGRVLAGKTDGIYDAAVAATRILDADVSHPNGQVEILIQNRGTEPLINTSVQVSTGAGVITSNITLLAPNAVQTVRVPVPQAAVANPEGLRVDARVVVGEGFKDMKPSNNRRVETYVMGANGS